jgi:hypothetical protein
MKYIAYCLPLFIPGDDKVTLQYCSVPQSEAALKELNRLGADILGQDLTAEQCMMRVCQHDLAIDALQCLS